ncbi:MAG TPA: hypothetical protein VFH94_17990 [Streptomyces sp.]|nr:hypothetical protein [Streptomyces sp.]
MRRRAPAAAALTLGLVAAGSGGPHHRLVAAGCGDGDGKDVTEPQDVLFQPVAAQGPDPFTASTAESAAALPSDATGSPSSTGDGSATSATTSSDPSVDQP